MESHTTNFYGIMLEVFGIYESPDEETGYKGGWLGERIEHNGTDITCLVSETMREQIDEQILEELI